MGILLMETSRMERNKSHLFSYWFCSFLIGREPELQVFMPAHPDESHIIRLLQDPLSPTQVHSTFTYEPSSHRIERISVCPKVTDPVLSCGWSEICKAEFILGSVKVRII
jgi:hypothetical protein